jgi:hypothetical protein
MSEQRPDRCPICGGPNDCGMAAGKSECWCASVKISPEAPKRIECFDVSHIQGTDKVASMVGWEEGRMKKSDYR